MIDNDVKYDWFDAIDKCSYIKTKRLLGKHKDIINIQDFNGFTAICSIAASCKNKKQYLKYQKITDLLLSHTGIDVNKATNLGDNALLWATYYNNIEMVKSLLKNPLLDVNKKSLNGTTALMISMIDINDKITLFLLKHPNVNLTTENINGKNFINYNDNIIKISKAKLQKIILTKEPSLISSFVNNNIQIHQSIINEFKHLISSSELNLI